MNTNPKYRSIGWIKRSSWQMLVLSAAILLTPGRGPAAQTLHSAVESGDLQRVQSLTVDGADLDLPGPDNEPPLLMAALHGNGDIAAYLLQRGADIDVRNTSGLTALHAAAYGGHDDIAALLLAKGADINVADNRFGVAPLHVAAEENRLSTVSLLLKKGADVHVTEVNGYTPLSRAGFREHWEIVELLIANGAKCQSADKVGDWLYTECSKRVTTN